MTNEPHRSSQAIDLGCSDIGVGFLGLSGKPGQKILTAKCYLPAGTTLWPLGITHFRLYFRKRINFSFSFGSVSLKNTVRKMPLPSATEGVRAESPPGREGSENKLLHQETGGEGEVGGIAPTILFLCVAFETEEGVRTNSQLSLTLRNSRKSLLLPDTPLHDQHGVLCFQNKLNSFRGGCVLVPKYSLCPKNSLYRRVMLPYI